MDQEIRFCTTTDGTRIAYAVSGDGPPVVRVFDWYTHLELELNDRGWSEFYSTLSSQHRLIRYDLPGVGLSDRDVRVFSHRAKVGYLASVVDALELERVDLFSMAVGGPTAIAYAGKYPERVRKLILFGTYAVCAPDDRSQGEVDAITTLIAGGRAAPGGGVGEAFRVATPAGDYGRPIGGDDSTWGEIVEPDTAAAIYQSYWNLDVSKIAAHLTVPTLVIHRRGDAEIPFEWGRDLAALIPDARFVPVDGSGRGFVPDDPGTRTIIAAITEFLVEVDEVSGEAPGYRAYGLSAREAEVLRLLASGLANREIAEQLSLSVHTVNRHLTNVYRKIDARNRAEAVAFAFANNLA
jgi:pimeloyl-ACP methyl ester carboxylesterase/DNA-binding CsgD family transcriptional regulator